MLSLKETTIESTQKAAQARLIQEAAEKKRLEEEERLREEKRQVNGKDTILSEFYVLDLWFIANTVNQHVKDSMFQHLSINIFRR